MSIDERRPTRNTLASEIERMKADGYIPILVDGELDFTHPFFETAQAEIRTPLVTIIENSGINVVVFQTRILADIMTQPNPTERLRSLEEKIVGIPADTIILVDPGPKPYNSICAKMARPDVRGDLGKVFDMYRFALVVGPLNQPDLGLYRRLTDIIEKRILRSGYFSPLSDEERRGNNRIIPVWNDITSSRKVTRALRYYYEELFYDEFGRNYRLKGTVQSAHPNARVEVRLITTGLFLRMANDDLSSGPSAYKRGKRS